MTWWIGLGIVANARNPSAAGKSEPFDYFAEVAEGDIRPAPDDAQPSHDRPPEQATTIAAELQSNPQPHAINMRLWMEWGDGTPRQWRGSLRLDRGSFAQLHRCGHEADAIRAIYIADDQVHIAQVRPSKHDCLSVLVSAPQDATLSVSLASADKPEEPALAQISIQRLISDAYFSNLDQFGNRLVIRRAPGDRLRIIFQRDSLVFAPGERFDFSVAPNLTPVEPGKKYRCHVRLLEADYERQVFADARGQLSSAEFSIVTPAQEGVHNLSISLDEGQTTPLVQKPWRYEQDLQLVVVGSKENVLWSPRTVQVGGFDWKNLDEIKPGSTTKGRGKTWKPFPWFMQSQSDEPVSFGTIKLRQMGGKEFVELGPNAWQTHPLEIGEVGEPHILEVDYPTDQPHTLGISIVEPNVAGKVDSLGLDSGVRVSGRMREGEHLATHRLIFWPRSETPRVLLTNRGHGAAAFFGSIRVLGGLKRLNAKPKSDTANGRMLGVYYDKPFFPENFSAKQALDPSSGWVLKDWETFYQGGKRLVEYLSHVGYNAATICVARDGSTIYPSRLLASTSRFDNGVYFSNGQEPMQKDVLEMLLRMFDREGLRLIPAIQLSAPLLELEPVIRQERAGVELVDAEGYTWVERFGTHHGSAPYYNPLDQRVQEAIRRVVLEVVDRYAHHESFAGVAIQLDPTTYVQLPDEPWGCDDVTLIRFSEETRTNAGHASLGSAEDESELLNRWLNWRAQTLARWYRQMGRDVSEAKEGARLYLVGADMLASPTMQDRLRPYSPLNDINLDDAMLGLGIHPAHFSDGHGVMFLRPERVVSDDQREVDLELALEAQKDKLFRPNGSSDAGALYYHPPRIDRLPSFDKLSPFGSDTTNIRLASHIAPSTAENRRRLIHSLAALDAQVFFDGGWMAVLGQEDALQHAVDVFRRLPAQRFETVEPTSTDAGSKRGDDPTSPARTVTQPITVRRLTFNEQTYMYVVNDSPWPATASLNFSSGRYRLASLTARKLPELIDHAGGRNWSLPMEPYDLVAFVLSAPDVVVSDWSAQIPGEVMVSLKQGLQEFQTRVNRRRGPPLSVLPNPDFEDPAVHHGLSGWEQSYGKGIIVELDSRQAQHGRNSARLESIRPSGWTNGPVVWIRSPPFQPPRYGRIGVTVWLKTSDPGRQPAVQLVLEGRLNDTKFSRELQLGESTASDAPCRIGQNWTEHLLLETELPTRGLHDLRVRLDVRGVGEVWVDNLQVFDHFLTDQEQQHFLSAVNIANAQLDRGQLNDCRQFLDSYWSQFLRLHVPLHGAIEPGYAQTNASQHAPLPAVDERNSRQNPIPVRPNLQTSVQRLPANTGTPSNSTFPADKGWSVSPSSHAPPVIHRDPSGDGSIYRLPSPSRPIWYEPSGSNTPLKGPPFFADLPAAMQPSDAAKRQDVAAPRRLWDLFQTNRR